MKLCLTMAKSSAALWSTKCSNWWSLQRQIHDHTTRKPMLRWKSATKQLQLIWELRYLQVPWIRSYTWPQWHLPTTQVPTGRWRQPHSKSRLAKKPGQPTSIKEGKKGKKQAQNCFKECRQATNPWHNWPESTKMLQSNETCRIVKERPIHAVSRYETQS